MSPRPRPVRTRHGSQAPVFAALGDETRLGLVNRLSRGGPLSISELSHGSRISRQAVTKHLRVLEEASLVRSGREGRRMLFRFEPERVRDAAGYLGSVSGEWDLALARLKSLVESG